MYLFKVISVLLSVGFTVSKDAPTELDIKTTYLPRDCPAKAQDGDSLKVHYVGARRFFCAYNLLRAKLWNCFLDRDTICGWKEI